MRKVFVFDTRTGGNAFSIPFVKGSLSWTESRNKPQQVRFKVPGYDERLASIPLFDRLQPLRRSVAVVENGVVRAMGIITRHPSYALASKSLEISAVGPEYIFKRRLLIKEEALRGGWGTTIQDEDGKDVVVPNPELRLSFINQDWPTMVSNMIKHTLGWDGASLPFIYPPAGEGAHTREYDAIDAMRLLEALDDIRDLQDGPEIQITNAMYKSEFRYVLSVGDDKTPLVSSGRQLIFSDRGRTPAVRNVEVETDSDGMGSRSWTISGDVEDFHLSTHDDFNLLNQNFPLLDIVDTSRRSIVNQETLDSYDRKALQQGQKFSRFFSFEVNVLNKKHPIEEIMLGDWCILDTKGDNYLPAGRYRLRIAEITYQGGMWASVTTDGIEIA